MKNSNRFEVIYKQGTIDIIEILVDRETGVNYIFRTNGYAGGITPLLDESGNVVIDK